MKNHSPTLTATLSLIALTFLQTSGASNADKPFSIVYENTRWENKSVKVCFGNSSHYPLTGMPSVFDEPEDHAILKNGEVIGDFTDNLRLKVLSIIQREYTLSRTGIEFVGWESCNETASNADAVLMIGSEKLTNFGFDGYAAVGRNLNGKDDYKSEDRSKKAFIYIGDPETYRVNTNIMSREQFLEILVVHEFGHLAGLVHENFRLSKKNKDLNCERTIDGYQSFMDDDAVIDEPLIANVKAYSQYDPNSVMSYCYWDVLAEKTGMNFTIDHTLGEEFIHEPNEKGHFAPTAIGLYDPTVFELKKTDSRFSHIKIKAGLSLGDIHTLRCQHGFYSENVAKKKCHPDFNPTQDPALLKLARE